MLLLSLFCANANSQITDTGDSTKTEINFPGAELIMNSYKLEDFGNFTDNWKMVTVRFREDTKEMRVTYANPLAYEYLVSDKKKTDYPDGAVFAKIGIKTINDPMFTSSIVPAGAKRFQFMVHDQKKFANTGGWGYVLFNSEGKTFPGEVQKNSEACFACHTAVESKGYVFSELASFNTKLEPVAESKKQNNVSALKFVNFKAEELPVSIKKYLDKKIVIVDLYEGEMSKRYFQGTLDEILPTLIERSVKNAKVTIFLSDDKKEFSMVESSINKKKCTNSDEPLRVVVHQTMGVPEKKNSSKLIFKVIQKESCRAVLI